MSADRAGRSGAAWDSQWLASTLNGQCRYACAAGNLQTTVSNNQVSGSLRTFPGLYQLQTVSIISIVRATGEVLVSTGACVDHTLLTL